MDVLSSADLAALWATIWPALGIAVLRAGDVTLNVFRTLFVVQERRLLAALVAGAEAAMWLSAAGIVFATLSPVRAVGYVVGVAAGTALGIEVARRIRMGMVTVRVYVDATRIDDDGSPLEMGDRIAAAIREAGFAATAFRGRGYRGEVDMVLSTLRRRDAERVVAIARAVDHSAMAAVDNTLDPAPLGGTSTAGRV